MAELDWGNNQHWKTFLALSIMGDGPDALGGKNAKDFSSKLEDVEPADLPDRQLIRSDVFDLAEDDAIATRTVCAAIMAWGGMNELHAERLFRTENQAWVALCQKLRKDGLPRQTAYEEFRKLRLAGGMPGAGPAFFTKLIYFLSKRHRGTLANAYIMDQWVGCSTNLILGKDIVLMNFGYSQDGRHSFIVSDLNRPANYELFCDTLDAMLPEFDDDPEKLDSALMSKRYGDWREYVRKHRVL